jgi:hypothetical protein
MLVAVECSCGLCLLCVRIGEARLAARRPAISDQSKVPAKKKFKNSLLAGKLREDRDKAVQVER